MNTTQETFIQFGLGVAVVTVVLLSAPVILAVNSAVIGWHAREIAIVAIADVLWMTTLLALVARKANTWPRPAFALVWGSSALVAAYTIIALTFHPMTRTVIA